MITFTSLTGNIVALLGGVLVFHDPIGLGPPQIAARIAADHIADRLLGATFTISSESRRGMLLGR